MDVHLVEIGCQIREAKWGLSLGNLASLDFNLDRQVNLIRDCNLQPMHGSACDERRNYDGARTAADIVTSRLPWATSKHGWKHVIGSVPKTRMQKLVSLTVDRCIVLPWCVSLLCFGGFVRG